MCEEVVVVGAERIGVENKTSSRGRKRYPIIGLRAGSSWELGSI